MSDGQHRLASRYDELRRFPSVAEADAAVTEWQSRQMLIPGFWLALAAFALVVGGVSYVVLKTVKPWLQLSERAFQMLYAVAVVPIFGAFVVIGTRWICRRRFKRFLRERLAAMGVPICIKCGYDLRGQEDPRCPECGTGFEMP